VENQFFGLIKSMEKTYGTLSFSQFDKNLNKID